VEAAHLALNIIRLPGIIYTVDRLVREGKLTSTTYEQTLDLILKKIADLDIYNLTHDVVTRTIRCLENNQLRAMDAFHLGRALTVEPDLFVSSYQLQVEATRREGPNVMQT
jgi:uncharacterized protein